MPPSTSWREVWLWVVGLLNPRLELTRLAHGWENLLQSPTSQGGDCNLGNKPHPDVPELLQSPTSRGGDCNGATGGGQYNVILSLQSPTSRGGDCN